MMNVNRAIADALAAKKKMSSAECRKILTDLSARRGEVNRRIEEIRPAKNRSSAGPLRQKTLLEGDLIDIRNMDEEYELLNLEIEQLNRFGKEIDARLTQAQNLESAEAAPLRISELENAIAEAEKARDNLKKALSKVDTAYDRLWQERSRAVNAGFNVPTCSQDILDRIESLIPWTGPTKFSVFGWNVNRAEYLGLAAAHDHLTANYN